LPFLFIILKDLLMLRKSFFVLFLALFLTACNDAQITSNNSLSKIDSTGTIVIYSMNNYTDTPHAGMRAANIAEGILLSKGYSVKSRIDESLSHLKFSEKLSRARNSGAKYLLSGGVSEWRYKTGIDGEPAVSLHLKIVNTSNGKVVWSATGSDSSWGNTSIGVLAQELLSSMFLENAI
jgi:hypothetical protein